MSALRKALAAGVFFVALLLWTANAHADDAAEVEQAQRLLESAEYDAAAKRFEKLLSSTGPVCPAALTVDGCRLTTRESITRARAFYVMVLLILDRKTEAHAEMRTLLSFNESFTPSPAIFTQKVIDLYVLVKAEITKEKEQRQIDLAKKREQYLAAQKAYDDWVTEIETLAKTETITVEKQRWVAAIPFGIGQFYNNDIGLGVFFAALEGAFTTSAVVTGIMWATLVECGTDRSPAPICNVAQGKSIAKEGLNDQMETVRIVNYVSMGLLAVSILAGVIEAQVSFEPTSSSSKPRAVPPRPPRPEPPPELSVTGVPNAPDAVGAGLMVRF